MSHMMGLRMPTCNTVLQSIVLCIETVRTTCFLVASCDKSVFLLCHLHATSVVPWIALQCKFEAALYGRLAVSELDTLYCNKKT